MSSWLLKVLKVASSITINPYKNMRGKSCLRNAPELVSSSILKITGETTAIKKIIKPTTSECKNIPNCNIID